METRTLPLNVSPCSFLPANVGSLVRPLEPMLSRWLIPDRLLQCVPEGSRTNAAEYAREFLENLDIRYEINASDQSRIPARGGVLVVCNHPFGFLEGLILLDLLQKIRSDYRIVANGLLANVPAVRDRMIFLNPFRKTASPSENGSRLRACIDWLRSGGLLVMFPAGEVAHLTWRERPVADPTWQRTAARLAVVTQSPALPVFFGGMNSPRFQIMGAIHPSLRTLALPNELVMKSSETVELRAGSLIPYQVLKSCGDSEAATSYLRARTYLLSNRSVQKLGYGKQISRRNKELAAQAPHTLLEREIEKLPADRVLASNEDFAVYLAQPSEVPQTLREIGRCREATFRAVGEGTGREVDVDEYDDYYQQLILWNSHDKRIAGGYRLAATPDVLSRHGIKGLYSSTLFHYHPAFFDQIGPAVELGRSFVCREYQKHYAPLLLLWKGIAQYVLRRPECAVLFGAVSVSNDYGTLSRTLIVDFLKSQTAKDAAEWIKPRRHFRGHPLTPKPVKQLGRMLPTLDELCSCVEDLEADGKGLPVLIRQYLKIGGRMLGCNVDPRFSNALDVLVMADLRTASATMLERCMGKEGALRFRSFHAGITR